MQPTDLILDQIAELFSADDTTIAPAADACHLHLCASSFVPSPQTELTDLTEATFTGSAALSAGIGTQQSFVDPTSQKRVVQILEPAGGWHWECSVDPVSPETIFGYYLTNNDDDTLYGCALFPSPIVIDAAGQAIDIAQVRFTFLNQSPS